MTLSYVLSVILVNRRCFIVGLCGVLALAVAGCGAGIQTAGSLQNTGKIMGVVHGGVQPVSGATIQLYAVGAVSTGSEATPLLSSEVRTTEGGSFSLTGLYTCPSANPNVYLVATGGNPGLSSGGTNASLSLMAALGHCGDLTAASYISINEITTVAAVYALSPLMNAYSQIGASSSDGPLQESAFATAAELANSARGTTPGAYVVSGHTVQVNKLQTLANILTACVNSAGGSAGDGTPCGHLFSYATPASGAAPTDTVGALLRIAQNPTQNVTSIYNLNPPQDPYQPSLMTAPIDWSLALTPSTSALSITSSWLPASTTGTSYSAKLQATGGTPGYKWKVASGELPDGLALEPNTGAISGMSRQTGTSHFTVAVIDTGAPIQNVSTPLTITTNELLAINPAALGSGVVGTAYGGSLSASGGTLAYTWSITSGILPAGLTLAANTGVITGTPLSSGSSSFTATVSDNGSPAQTASITTTITVAPSQLAVTKPSLSSGTVGAAYNGLLSASGGMPAYVWSITSGVLPAGLTLAASTGMITGTPTSSGSLSFTATVSDNGSPAQTASIVATIAVAPGALTITTSDLPAGTTGIAYSVALSANGGTPAYTWSIISGNLPAGMSLAATTGVISGTPAVSGTSSFSIAVSDNGPVQQVRTAPTSITIAEAAVASNPGNIWYVRPDGGTRYSAHMPQGQCDGLADTSYSGTGVNQHCAYNDFRYMWDDRSGVVGAGAWVIAGGDTVVIRGCHALPDQQNAANPDCRIGWDGSYGSASGNWCYGVGSYTCYNPPIPAGTTGNHTKILGACAYGAYTCTPINNSYPYGSTNETQLFGGYSLTWTFNLTGTQNVDIEGIELTTHNGQCVRGGAPAYPRWCSNNQPLDDFAQNGFMTDNTTANVTLQDVYVHGFNSSGLYGPIGGAIIATRLFSGFNGFAGWNFADTTDTPDAPGSSITASYVTMIGNGCYEQYPIVNGTFPAQACYDDLSQGFGDAWSGQDTLLDTLICDHCVQKYNTKDGFIGPHTQIKHLTITNSASIGNMGSQWKFGTDTDATVLFENNLTVGNSYRMGAALPGASQNFSLGSALPGSYLSDFGRAGGDMFSIITQAGSSLHFYGNSMVLASQTGMDFNCGVVNRQGNTAGAGTCAAVPVVWTDNLFMGYTDPNCNSCGGLAPGLWYKADSSINITSSYNLEYGIRNGDPCGANNNLCTDPFLYGEPGQAWPGSESALDVYDPITPRNSFHPATGSALMGAGQAINGLTSDYYGVTQPTIPTIGAVAK